MLHLAPLSKGKALNDLLKLDYFEDEKEIQIKCERNKMVRIPSVPLIVIKIRSAQSGSLLLL